MKPNTDITPGLLDNLDRFTDPFYQRLTLKPADKPLALSKTVKKTYLFPTLYGDVTCAIGVFLCDTDRAKALLPSPAMQPVRMTKGRSLVIFSCYEYKVVSGIAPYNEIAMTIPVMVNPTVNVPVLPMILPVFPAFGYYVFSMPVTSLENQIRGVKIWGLPKVVHEIDIREEEGDCVTSDYDERGEKYFELRVPMTGKPTKFDVRSNLYSKLDGRLLQSETRFASTFAMTKNMQLLWKTNVRPDRQVLWIGDGPSAKVLDDLRIDPNPFQLRFAKGMTSCFDLPNSNFVPPAGA
jgi:hypothetical protein